MITTSSRTTSSPANSISSTHSQERCAREILLIQDSIDQYEKQVDRIRSSFWENREAFKTYNDEILFLSKRSMMLWGILEKHLGSLTAVWDYVREVELAEEAA